MIFFIKFVSAVLPVESIWVTNEKNKQNKTLFMYTYSVYHNESNKHT